MVRSVDALPGGDLVAEGLTDLREGREAVAAVLVPIGPPRLGIDVPRPLREPEQGLCQRLRAAGEHPAHSRCTGLVRRLVSFKQSLACDRP